MHESHARSSRDRGFDLKNSFRQISGSICAPRGFKSFSVFCDIKKLGTGKGSEKGRKDDLALIVSDVPASVASAETTADNGGRTEARNRKIRGNSSKATARVASPSSPSSAVGGRIGPRARAVAVITESEPGTI